MAVLLTVCATNDRLAKNRDMKETCPFSQVTEWQTTRL
jgi:hypothetical protein